MTWPRIVVAIWLLLVALEGVFRVFNQAKLKGLPRWSIAVGLVIGFAADAFIVFALHTGGFW